MRIFVTGASGFIGNKLAWKLADQGHEVHTLVRNRSAVQELAHPRITVFFGDVRSAETIEPAIAGCEQVYHIAGFAKLWARKPQIFYDVNVKGTENVLTLALKHHVKKLVFTSSCAVFGPSLKEPIIEEDPRITAYKNNYDLSKYMAEALVRDYAQRGLYSVIVNPSRVYGPGLQTHSNTITRMVSRAIEGKWVLMPGIRNVVGNYVFIDDVVEGHIQAMKNGLSGERYILGGENVSYSDVISIVKQEIRNARIIPLPVAAVKGWGYIELLKNRITGNDPLFTPESVGRYLQNAAFNCQKAKQQLGYSITGFREGIQQTIVYLKQRA
jgi:nucleoside-diphosphate-sugar epimerase